MTPIEFVIVGCGGTGYALRSHLMVALESARLRWPSLTAVDPKSVDAKPGELRQWPKTPSGASKALAFIENMGIVDSTKRRYFRAAIADLPVHPRTGGAGEMVFVLCVDNDRARLDAIAKAQEFSEKETEERVWVVNLGCSRRGGQSWVGLCIDGEWVHDLRKAHPDMGSDKTPEEHPNCAADVQSYADNAMTAVLGY